MNCKYSTSVITTIVLLIMSGSGLAIEKVAPRLNYFSLYGSQSTPTGSYDNVGGIIFTDESGNVLNIEVDADELYDPGYVFGFSYGQIRNKKLSLNLGFQYTKFKTDDNLVFSYEKPSFNLFEVWIRGGWYFTDIRNNTVAPYLGLGLGFGYLQVDYQNLIEFDKMSAAMSLDFGGDIKLWTSSDTRSFLTLTSFNSYNIVTTDERPSDLTIGGGIKYFFRP